LGKGRKGPHGYARNLSGGDPGGSGLWKKRKGQNQREKKKGVPTGGQRQTKRKAPFGKAKGGEKERKKNGKPLFTDKGKGGKSKPEEKKRGKPLSEKKWHPGEGRKKGLEARLKKIFQRRGGKEGEGGVGQKKKMERGKASFAIKKEGKEGINRAREKDRLPKKKGTTDLKGLKEKNKKRKSSLGARKRRLLAECWGTRSPKRAK